MSSNQSVLEKLPSEIADFISSVTEKARNNRIVKEFNTRFGNTRKVVVDLRDDKTCESVAILNNSSAEQYMCFWPNGNIKSNSFFDEDTQLIKLNNYNEVGQKHGNCFSKYDNGKDRKFVTYKNGKLDGLCNWYYENGMREISTEYKDGELDGKYYEYHENGELSMFTQNKNGAEYGTRFEYREDGTLSLTAEYEDNLEHGEEIEYYEDGTTIKINVNYVKGKLEGTTYTFYENGNVKTVEDMHDDKFHGECFEYDENGNCVTYEKYDNDQLLSYTKYSRDENGKLYVSSKCRNNRETMYYPNKSIEETGTMLNGERNGWTEYYDINGTLTGEDLFENGEVVLSKSYDKNNSVDRLIKTKNDVVTYDLRRDDIDEIFNECVGLRETHGSKRRKSE